ncbi:hypothetical protein G4B88_002446 [Cannabis sativa]|uniref:Protein kinase domain-containing protein n=2 Tax=Cannabis sativa TaxID=3483 RepID=A0A7J6I7Q3_CANSA|nr:hypothetical protein G4B88_002446 [Cannabis sativa]
MGCICSKGLAKQYDAENNGRNKEANPNKHLKKKRLEAHAGIDNSGNDATARLISNPRTEENVGFAPVLSDEVGKRAVVVSENLTRPQLPKQPSSIEVGGGNGGQVHPRVSRASSVTNGEKGAQVIAGWPSWLTAVAGEAISGWVPRKADSFEKLEKIGQGTYSSVYKARDLDTNKLVALKKVRFATMDPESVRFMAREILILRRLDHPNIMKLEGLITSRVSGSLYLVFEYMEHDLAGLASRPGVKFTEAQIKCYMRQLLQGLEHCHSHGVLHRDIKGSNLLIDNYGNLKIGDFGLANFYGVHQKQPLTSRVVTLWYRPPELLLGSTEYGVAVDLWSAGCIVAELFAGKPIMPGRTEVEQLHKIFKLCGSPSEEYWKRSKLPHATIFKPTHPYKRCVAETFKDFPSSTLSLLEKLLAVEPAGRGTASSALQSEFFTMKPLPCDPSTLPKYPPSKEFDAKLRDEEARRLKAAGKEVGYESLKKGSRVSKAVPAPDANAELQSSIQKHKGQHNPKSVSEKFNHEEEGGSGFLIEPPRDMSRNGIPQSGQSMLLSAFGSHNMDARAGQSRNGAELRSPRSNVHRGAVELSRFSNSVAARSESWFDSSGETSMTSHWPEERINGGYSQLNGGDSSGKQEWSHHLLERPMSSHKNKDEPMSEKEPSAAYAYKKNRIHYSGPLMPAGGNLDEMLKEHEKKIQHAVRKARVDKTKTKKTHNGPGLITESLLHHSRNDKGSNLSLDSKEPTNDNNARRSSSSKCPPHDDTQTCTKIPPSLAQTLIHYTTSTITPQQTLREISVSARVLEKKSPCNFLVFGLGHDSLMWSALNYGGRTVFLEEDEAWIEQIRRRFPTLESYHVTYESKVHEADNLMDVGKGPECTAVSDPKFSMCQLALKGLPSLVYETKWDVIMVDAPTGYYDEAPGRMTAIYTAGMMARNREEGETDVFVHDVNRVVEDKFSMAFLCEGYMKKQEGRLRHFNIPSHRDGSDRPFCPTLLD